MHEGKQMKQIHAHTIISQVLHLLYNPKQELKPGHFIFKNVTREFPSQHIQLLLYFWPLTRVRQFNRRSNKPHHLLKYYPFEYLLELTYWITLFHKTPVYLTWWHVNQSWTYCRRLWLTLCEWFVGQHLLGGGSRDKPVHININDNQNN